jgi:hypothetical protein
LLVQIEGEGVEVESLVGIAVGMNAEMTVLVDSEVTDPPTFDIVEIEGVANGPVLSRNSRILLCQRAAVLRICDYSKPMARRWQQAAVAAGTVALALAAAVAWAIPRPLGDLYLALAGGRDVLQGKLGRPDDWSFATLGRTWVNASWGADLLFAGIHRMSGDAGLLGLKALLLGALGLLLAASARARGATLAAALVAAALALAASPQDLILRPNLLSLLFVPVLLLWLGRREKGPFWPLGTVVLFALWVNVHGAFVFGLLLLALWVPADLLERRFSASDSRPAGPVWVGPAALGASCLVALFANPFGPRNVFLQLVVPRSETWRNVIEWGPLWGSKTPGVAFPVLFLVIALLVILSGAGDLGRRATGGGPRAFDLLLTVVVVGLAVSARRLVPWAAVALAPQMARALDTLFQSRRTAVALAGAGVLLAGFLAVDYRWVPQHYARNHPLFPNESILERMVLHGTHFPGGAAVFLERNHVRARAFHEWRWEGYLREHAPELQLFVGGRAHQVYDEATYKTYRRLLAGPDPRSILRALDVSVAVVPLTPEYGNLCQRLLSGEGAWVYVYADRYTAVLADPWHPATQALVAGVAEGQAVYPDSASAALSRAMCLSSPGTEKPERAVPLLQTALALRPTGYAYPVLVKEALRAGVTGESVIAYLEGEEARLARMSAGAPEENALLESRLFIAGELERLYPPEEKEKRRLLAANTQFLEERMDAIARRYPSFYRS